jgi:hypothetical protein
MACPTFWPCPVVCLECGKQYKTFESKDSSAVSHGYCDECTPIVYERYGMALRAGKVVRPERMHGSRQGGRESGGPARR